MSIRFAPARVDVERAADGRWVLRSPEPLGAHARCVGEWLVTWAERAPERSFLAERGAGGDWRRLSYGEALQQVRGIGQALLERGLSPARPLLLLSENAIDHALLLLGAMHAGVPVAPVSPAYSTASKDLERLRQIAAQLQPGAVWAADRQAYARALEALSPVPVLDPVAELAATPPGAQLDRAFAALGPDTIAKVLFTSGSTGNPKGVVNTQRMLTANQQMIAQLWPFLDERPPVVVDWLPWSHTFGGNHDFHLVLRAGGTLYVDRGRPMPGAIEISVENLRDVSPTLYFNVPRGFDLLLPFLERDADFRQRFFARLDLAFYAAAALPPPLWARFQAQAEAARGRPATLVSAWGSTETAPMATAVHFPIDRAGVIGLPPPGGEIALAPVGDRHELRVRGPHVTPGYFRPGGAIEPAPRDPHGFLPTGDAGRLFDESAPERGLVFDGRIAENFKLSSGTWVAVGALRLQLIAACAPHVADAVIAGHDRAHLAAILFVHPTGHDLRAHLSARLAAHNRAHPGGATAVRRVVIAVEPPSIDAGEITDKGYLNQRAILTRRAHLVDALFAEAPPPDVLVIDG